VSRMEQNNTGTKNRKSYRMERPALRALKAMVRAAFIPSSVALSKMAYLPFERDFIRATIKTSEHLSSNDLHSERKLNNAAIRMCDKKSQAQNGTFTMHVPPRITYMAGMKVDHNYELQMQMTWICIYSRTE
jgi:hypothetical protein